MQDLRGSQIVGGNFNKNNAVFALDWDLIVIDEAHEGTQTKLGDNVVKALKKSTLRFLHSLVHRLIFLISLEKIMFTLGTM